MLNKPVISEIELEETHSQPTRNLLENADISLVEHVPVKLSVLVGTLSIKLGHMFSLKCGETLTLNESIDDPVSLMLDGKVIAIGHLVVVDDNFGFKVTELA
jgi:flagellar motor switch protein FliN/FliY